VSDHLFARFEQVRIINLVDRPDRRREMTDQLERIGALGPNVAFHDAHRPNDQGQFPSIGARGCFESHLAVLRGAREANAESLLLLEDDFDFSRGGLDRAPAIFSELFNRQWDIFYGAHLLDSGANRGLRPVPPDIPIVTASFVGFRRDLITDLVDFLEAMQRRPGGSPEYGPMHVDGAYTVYRQLHPTCRTLAAFPTLGTQRSSRSDITPSGMLLDRWAMTRDLAGALRRGRNWLRRRSQSQG